MKNVAAGLRRLWSGLRGIAGDDAYERYLAHLRLRHSDSPPLDRAAFYLAELERRWDGIHRCC